MHALLWVIDGLVVGLLMGKFMSSEGRDWVMDIVMGLAGAVAGGFLLSAALGLIQGKMIYTNLAAVSGAVLLTIISRHVGGRREYGSTD
jgi:uncharacterized membrane protein YeaQ/YmgE (transglycosylase-associated protein family)